MRIPATVSLAILLFCSAVWGQTAPAVKLDTARYLPAEQARQIMLAEQPEPYLSRFETLEMSAKTGKPMEGKTAPERLEELRKRYAAAVQDFQPEDAQIIDDYLSKLDPLVTDYPLYAQTPWCFIKVANELESGFPHTRGDAIVLTSKMIRQLADLRKRSGEQALFMIGPVLLHEKMHIVQRAHPKLVADLYTRVWGFEHAAEVDVGPWLRNRQLLNPDGPDLHWVYKLPPAEGQTDPRYVLPMISLAKLKDGIVPTNFSAGGLIAVELDKQKTGYVARIGPDGKPMFKDLAQEPALAQAFLPDPMPYHPNEIMADLFAMLVVKDAMEKQTGKQIPDTAAMAGLRKWLGEHFAKIVPAENAEAPKKAASPASAPAK